MKKHTLVNKITGVLLSILFLCSIQSCKTECEKNPDSVDCISNEEELLTTLKVLVLDSSATSVVDTFIFADADNNGAPERFDTIMLAPGSHYNVRVEIWNESASPYENITTEVEEEKNDHAFFFQATNIDVNISYSDFDSNNPPLPVGLQTQWQTGSAGNGSIRITLKHQPGVKDGTSTPGDTDIEVAFPCVIE